MPGKRGFNKRFIGLVSLFLVVAFINLVLSPSYSALENVTGRGINLHPQHRVFGAIMDKELGDKGMVEFTVLGRLRLEPGILLSTAPQTKDLFSKLVSGKEVEAFFSAAASFRGLVEKLGDSDLAEISMIPCFVAAKPYFTQLVRYKDGREKSTVYSRKEFDAYCNELVSDGMIDRNEVEDIAGKLTAKDIRKEHRERFVDITDEGVQAAKVFLESAGARHMSRVLEKMVNERKVILAGRGGPYQESIAINEKQEHDAKARALAILQYLMVGSWLEHKSANAAFEKFWKLWEDEREGEFDIDEVDPKLKLKLIDSERRSEGASNEGSINFSDEAYDYIFGLHGIETIDCEETRQDIIRIFREVAKHEMDEHNAAVDRGERKNKISESDMPGMDPAKIKFLDYSKCLLPTDIVTEDGTIMFNENFVKMMHLLGLKGLKDKEGTVYDYPVGNTPRGDLYSSIIYSIAIHTIRGHFKINEWGFAVFDPDEYQAQGERGKSHLYVNVLAMMFYWVICLEHHEYPKQRVRFFMDKYPQMFKGLTPEQREKLPEHLVEAYMEFTYGKGRIFPLVVDDWKTGMTREKVDAILEQYPNAASNEGDSENQDMWADAAVEALVMGKHPQALKDEGEKIVLALETDGWVPAEQKLMIQKLIQQVGKLSGAGTVEVIRGSADELAGKLTDYIEKEKVPLKNVVVLASLNTISRKEFDPIRAKEGDTDVANKAFFAGVDAQKLTEDSYIRLLEMVTMAVRMAFGQKSISDHPGIEVIEMNARCVIFIPRAEPMDYDLIKKIYENQIKILIAA